MFEEILKEPLLKLRHFIIYHGHSEWLKYAKTVKEIMNQNYCQFNNSFYKPPKGLAMGLHISPILAEIFMNDFENRILEGSWFWGMIKH